jgi:hypothetical protein
LPVVFWPSPDTALAHSRLASAFQRRFYFRQKELYIRAGPGGAIYRYGLLGSAVEGHGKELSDFQVVAAQSQSSIPHDGGIDVMQPLLGWAVDAFPACVILRLPRLPKNASQPG